ncbi:MAG: hypothetical protein AAFU41_19285, partial [Pseudomonadota bacterium]
MTLSIWRFVFTPSFISDTKLSTQSSSTTYSSFSSCNLDTLVAQHSALLAIIIGYLPMDVFIC